MKIEPRLGLRLCSRRLSSFGNRKHDSLRLHPIRDHIASVAFLAAVLLLASAIPARTQSADLVAVESEETKDRNAIAEKVQFLLTGRDYDSLDRLADELRRSKETYVDGYWKLWAFYEGFPPSKRAPDEQWTARLGAILEWVKQKPDSVSARVALAEALTGYAWKARGGGYADTVTATGSKLFEERLAESRRVLDGANKLKTVCPHSFAVAQRIALGEGWGRETYEKLFAAAIQCEPTYGSYYFRKVLHLMPRWHGQPGDWEKAAEESANRIGGDDGDILYARIAWFVHDLGFYEDIFRETNLNGNRVKRGYDLMLKRYPQSLTLAAQLGRLAVVNRDPHTAGAMLERLGGKVDLEIWSSLEWFKQVRDWTSKNGRPLVPGQTSAQSLRTPEVRNTPAASPAQSPASAAKRDLTLNGISGGKGNRLAIINGQTLAVGESAQIRLAESQVKVRCEEIREDSVVVTVDGKPERKELHFHRGN